MKNSTVHMFCDNRLHAVKYAFQEKKSYTVRQRAESTSPLQT